MKRIFKATLSLLILSLGLSFQALTQCVIEDVTATPSDCTNDGNFYVEITFEHVSIGAEGFKVQGNGNDYGNFSYDDLPITVGPLPGDGSTEYEFVVIDNQFDCHDFVVIDPVLCDVPPGCHIFDIIVHTSDCDADGNFTVEIDFEFQDVSDEGFTVAGNGNNYGDFNYGDLPITLGPFEGNGSLDYEFVVFDQIIDDCFEAYELGPVDCGVGGDCHIFDVIAEAHPCQDDGTFFVDIGFHSENGGNEGFRIVGNGHNYGNFSYDEEFVTLGPLEGDGSTIYEFILIDNQDDNCTAFTGIGPIDCNPECEITNFSFEVGECKTQSSYELTVNLEVSNPDNPWVELFYSGQTLGFYNLSEFPITFNNFYDHGEISPLLFACLYDSDCCAFAEFDAPNCNDNSNDCYIGGVFSITSDCKDEGTYNITLLFDAEDPGNDLFDVFMGDDIIGTFPLGDMPVTINDLEGDYLPYHILNICINDNPDCCREVVIENPCYGALSCGINDLIAELHPCDDEGNFYVDLAFHQGHTGLLGFSVLGNGNNYGSFDYGSDFITIGPLPGDGSINEFVIIDNEFPDCHDGIGFDPIYCGGGDCEIFDLHVDIGDCNDDGTFNLHVLFQVEGATNDFFEVFAGDELLGFFPLDELPLHILHFPSSGNEYDQITICINDHPDCCLTIDFLAPDCGGDDCKIFDVIAEAHPCDDDGNFLVDIDFEYQNVGNEGYKVLGNGTDYGNFSYDEPYITLGPLAGNGTIYEFVIIDNQDDNCTDYTTIGPIFCGVDCQIVDLHIEVGDCNADNMYSVWVNFEAINPTHSHFDLYIGDDLVGFFALDDLPVEVLLEGDAEPTVHNLTVCINDNEDCCASIDFESPPCGSVGDCEIYDLVVDPDGCNDDGTYDIWINFEVENPGNDFFEVWRGDDYLGFYPLNELPLLLENYPASGNDYDYLTVCINDVDDCCKTIEFMAPDCNIIWPGDANDDNIANNLDLLNIGLGYGTAGEQRDLQGIEWFPMVSQDWDQNFEDAINYKHADCDGNGEIQDLDINAIELNYGQTHGDYQPFASPPATSADASIFVDLPDPEDIILGVPFEAPIILGTDVLPVDDIYGLGFILNFNPDLINPSSIEISYEPSWLGVLPVNLITIDRTKADEGKVEMALVRTDQNNVSGFGQIAEFIGIIDNIAGKQEMSIEISNVKAIMENEELIPLRTPTEVIELITGVNNPDQNLKLTIFPNPTTEIIYIKNSMNYPLETVEIQDVNGRILYSAENPAGMISLDDFPSGAYIVYVKVDGRHFYERIIKMEKN